MTQEKLYTEKPKQCNKRERFTHPSAKYDLVTFHEFLPFKSFGNTVKQLGYLIILHRAQSINLKTKLLMFCTYSANSES